MSVFSGVASAHTRSVVLVSKTFFYCVRLWDVLRVMVCVVVSNVTIGIDLSHHQSTMTRAAAGERQRPWRAVPSAD